MNDGHHSSRVSTGRTSTVLLLGIVLLPVLYVLSVGPIIMLEMKGLLGRRDSAVLQSLTILYAPVRWSLHHEIPGFTPALNWYISLWTRWGLRAQQPGTHPQAARRTGSEVPVSSSA